MSDFSRPEYAAYVALCRDLRLPREFHFGDLVQVVTPISDLQYVVPHWPGFTGPTPERALPPDIIWLPSLSDWLAMLNAKESCWLGLTQCADIKTIRDDTTRPKVAAGATLEEAAARLWIEVAKVAK